MKVETACSNNVDDDGDGMKDCEDTDCAVRDCGGCLCTANNTRAETSCSPGGFDNDGDGKPDLSDPDCLGRVCTGTTSGCVYGDGAKVETACGDGVDNDGDTFTDLADPDCCALRTPVPAECEVSCADGVDNNTDAGTDCADVSCKGRPCNADGGLGCQCFEGARRETVCTPGSGDNDNDGLLDCADPDCEGRVCAGSGCFCYGGQRHEVSCADGVDNDGDGMKDCEDTDCAGWSCGANGKVCTGGVCACSGNGGLTQSAERACRDTQDNDCDGKPDCFDDSCAGSCESSCSDGLDNDGDGVKDCEDPDCSHRACDGAKPAAVCCSQLANALACKDLAMDLGNCGGCGVQCATGSACMPVASGALASGRCGCPAGAVSCPLTGTGAARLADLRLRHRLRLLRRQQLPPVRPRRHLHRDRGPGLSRLVPLPVARLDRPSLGSAMAAAVSCPSDVAISAYLAGALEPALRDEVDAHVDRCAICQGLLAALARAAPRNPLEGAERLGRYVILGEAWGGGMGVVVAAYDP